MKVLYKKNRLILYILTIFLLTNPRSLFAAPDPSEIEKIKENAPLHVIGEVVQDKVFQDFSNRKHPYQIRLMDLKVSQVIKAPDDMKEIKNLEVYYKYVPAWDIGEFVGGKRMDIAVSDIIEIWLEKGDYGFESALWGSTVMHIEYSDKRPEPIPEPFWHAFKRNVDNVLSNHMGILVVIFWIAVLGVVIQRGIKKKRY